MMVLKEETSMPAGPLAALQLMRATGCGIALIANRIALERGGSRGGSGVASGVEEAESAVGSDVGSEVGSWGASEMTLRMKADMGRDSKAGALS